MLLSLVGVLGSILVVRQGRPISVGQTRDLLQCRERRIGSGGLARFVHLSPTRTTVGRSSILLLCRLVLELFHTTFEISVRDAAELQIA